VSHLYVSSVIMMLLRTCSRPGPSIHLLPMVTELVSDHEFRKHLRYYSPEGRDSRLVPLLMRFNLCRILILYCRMKYRSHRRKAK
jgi:hypothetical protein